MFYGIILGIHVLVCILLCLVVLLQSSKGSGLAGGGAFGGGAESTVFGGRGAATFLSKATTIFGVAFMLTSLTLTLMGRAQGGRPRSAIAEEARTAPMGVPSETAPPTTLPQSAPPTQTPAEPGAPPPSGEETPPKPNGG
jgi:preprotein translocase subunit SecG